MDEGRCAWHAGESYWGGGDTDLNSASIGIEFVNNGEEPFPEAQIRACLGRLADIKARHRSSGMPMLPPVAKRTPAFIFRGSISVGQATACGAPRRPRMCLKRLMRYWGWRPWAMTHATPKRPSLRSISISVPIPGLNWTIQREKCSFVWRGKLL